MLSSANILRPCLLDYRELLCKLFKESISPYFLFCLFGVEGAGGRAKVQLRIIEGRKIALALFSFFSVARSSCQKDAARSLSEARTEYRYKQHQRDDFL